MSRCAKEKGSVPETTNYETVPGSLRGTRRIYLKGSCLPRLCCIVLSLMSVLSPVHSLSRLVHVHTWGVVDFNFPNASFRQSVIDSGAYAPGYSIPFDVDINPEDFRQFYSFPNMFPQSYITLATLPKGSPRNSPVFDPYPDISWHTGERGCDGLTSVFRMQIDPCGRLWVIDSGRVEILSSYTQRCPAQLLVFNLTDDSLLMRHRFDTSMINCYDSLLLNVVTERPNDDCSNNVFAYVSDTAAREIFVYSMNENRSWSVQSDFFAPDPHARTITMGRESFTLMDGVAGLSLSPRLRRNSNERWLYFNAISSYSQGRVSTAILRNSSLFEEGNSVPEAFGYIGDRESQIVPTAMTSKGVMFFSYLNQFSLNCWNSQFPYNSEYIARVDADYSLIRFVTGLKVVPVPAGEEVWLVANNAQRLFEGTYQANTTNSINVMRGYVSDLVWGNLCSLNFFK